MNESIFNSFISDNSDNTEERLKAIYKIDFNDKTSSKNNIESISRQISLKRLNCLSNKRVSNIQLLKNFQFKNVKKNSLPISSNFRFLSRKVRKESGASKLNNTEVMRVDTFKQNNRKGRGTNISKINCSIIDSTNHPDINEKKRDSFSKISKYNFRRKVSKGNKENFSYKNPYDPNNAGRSRLKNIHYKISHLRIKALKKPNYSSMSFMNN